MDPEVKLQEDDEEAEVKEHPLVNSLVLESILKYDASPQAVLRNRLVCPSWQDAVDKYWKTLPKYPVLRYESPDTALHSAKPLVTLFEFYIRYHEGDPTVTQMMAEPPRRMELYGWENHVGDPDTTELDLWFWSLTSTNFLTSLTLADCHFREDIPIYKPSFLDGLPCLQTLILKDCVIYKGAVEKVCQAHKLWLDHPGRSAWLEQRRNDNGQDFGRGDVLLPNVPPYFVDRDQQHQYLRILDISLKSSQETEPLLIWGPLLAMFPQLNKLKIGGGVTQGENGTVHFHELVDDLALGQVERTLRTLDLLDFSGEAQNRGLVGVRRFNLSSLHSLAFDMGLDPTFRQDYCSMNKAPNMRHLTLYRAPFAEQFPRMDLYMALDSVELWGNVAPNLEFQPVGVFGRPKKLVWNTTCYDNAYKGKRIQHLLGEKRRAYPLFTQDLISKTGNFYLQRLENVTHLDIDFGPLSEESWNRLGKYVRGLTTLMAVLGEDRDLQLVSLHWPDLVCLELKHRSDVSLEALKHILPQMEKLEEFSWKTCACTQAKFFEDEQRLRQIVRQIFARFENVELPWKWSVYGDKLVRDESCRQAEFEGALLKAAVTTEMSMTDMENENAELKRQVAELTDKMEGLQKQLAKTKTVEMVTPNDLLVLD